FDLCRRSNSSIKMVFMFLTTLYLFVLLSFVSSVGGFVFYKLIYMFLFPRTLSYILGGIASLLLCFSVAVMFGMVSLFYGLIIGLTIYIFFIVLSRKESE